MTLNLLARLAFMLALALPLGAQAETEQRLPLPERNPARAEAPPVEEPVLPADAPTLAWTDAEIAAAKADCAKVLAGLALDYETLPPIKEGVCGAPAPILLKAIGGDPKVEIDPPATVTCAVASRVSAWLSKTVQPQARARLGTAVVKLRNASSYVCRNRYNGTDTLLSEHALANALDVSEFVLQTGERVTVLESWAHPAVAGGSERTGSITAVEVARPNADHEIDATKVKASVKANPFVVPTDAKSNPFVRPVNAAKIAPPKPPAEASPPGLPSPPDPKALFVRKVHDDACNVFGTVLGPDANEAHRDHFHLDMKARRHKSFCE